MFVTSEGDVPYVDLDTLRPLVAAAWNEWQGLRFGADGWLLDADNQTPLAGLKLASGQHRHKGARYEFTDLGAESSAEFKLVSERDRKLRGKLGGKNWSSELDIGDQVTLKGHTDIKAMLREDDGPSGCMIWLIGGAKAPWQAELDPAALEGDGTLISVTGRMQRVRGEFMVELQRTDQGWHGEATAALTGRGLLGRLAMLAFGTPIRRQLEKQLGEIWPPLSSDQFDPDEIKRAFDEAGGTERWLHQELWQGLREASTPEAAAPESSEAP